jgi:hypothetical protein
VVELIGWYRVDGGSQQLDGCGQIFRNQHRVKTLPSSIAIAGKFLEKPSGRRSRSRQDQVRAPGAIEARRPDAEDGRLTAGSKAVGGAAGCGDLSRVGVRGK